jgi:adenosylhomocysteine nucleosidase
LTTAVVGVVCALKAEARHLSPPVRSDARLVHLTDGTLLTICGMGGAAAADGARRVIAAGAAALVSFGMAGGLDPALAAGRIFLPSEVLAEDGTLLATARRWREQLGVALTAHHPLTNGKLLTSARAVGSVSRKAALFQASGALAVDMESFAVAQVAAAEGVPFIAVRVSVDGARDTVPASVTEAADAAGEVQVGRLLRSMLLAPGDVVALVRLTRRYLAANRALAAVAHTGALTTVPPAQLAESRGTRLS